MDLIGFLTTYGGFIVAMIFAGVFGGLVAGLLGVGGGIVIVPVLYSILVAMGIDADIAIKTSVATSLTTIVFTSLSSARSHQAHGAVDFALLRAWAIPIAIGVVAGTVLASYAKGSFMTLVFAVIALLVAINMAVRGKGKPIWSDFPNAPAKAGFGAFVGFFSAIMGIGGGTLSVPILTAFGFDIRKAVGTASAIGFIIAVPATIGYIISGWGAPGLPPLSLGYPNLIACAALVPLTALFAPIGARIAHTIPPKALSYTFSAFLLATSVRMFWGVFF